MNSAKIRDFLRTNPYISRGKPSKGINNFHPETATFVNVFFEFCDKSPLPPTQEQYVNDFLERCKDELAERGVDKNELAKRIARNWATFIADIDFFCQLRDSGLFEDVKIDTVADIEKGCNIIVKHKGKEFYIQLYFQTASQEEWLRAKEKRKAGLPQALRFPLIPSNGDKIGGKPPHLYPNTYVRRLKELLEKEAKSEA